MYLNNVISPSVLPITGMCCGLIFRLKNWGHFKDRNKDEKTLPAICLMD
jgi:hypothetical protein